MKNSNVFRILSILLIFLYQSIDLSSQTAIATCTGITSATENNYRISVTGLNAAFTYDITINGILVADNFTGATSYTSANQTFVDGTGYKTVLIDQNGDGIGVVTVIVHELLCNDVDNDDDIDQNQASCNYTTALPNIGTIVSQVAPHNTQNVYLYILTNTSGVTTTPLRTNKTGLFTGLPDGDYKVYAYNFLSNTDANNFLSGISAGTNMNGFASSTDPCYSFCGASSTYTILCPCKVDINALPAVVNICQDGSGTVTASASITAPIPSGATLEFQWQQNTGSGFVNFADTDSILNFNNVTLAMDGYDYRVIVTLDVSGTNICNDTSTSVDLNVYPKAILSSGLNATVCSDQASGITLSTSGGGTLAYYNIPTATVAPGLTGSATTGSNLAANAIVANTFTNETANNLTVVYRVVPVSTDGCAGDTVNVTLTVRPEPNIADQTETGKCSDIAIGSVTYGSSSGVAATSFNITAVNSNGLTQSAGTNSVTDDNIGDDAWTNTTPASVNVVYTIVPTSAAGCAGDAFTVTVPINPKAVVEAGTGAPICSNGTVNLTTLGASISGGISTGTWSSSSGGTFNNGGVFGSATTYTPSAADKTAGSVTLTLTSGDPVGACSAVSDVVTIVINSVVCGTFPWGG